MIWPLNDKGVTVATALPEFFDLKPDDPALFGGYVASAAGPRGGGGATAATASNLPSPCALDFGDGGDSRGGGAAAPTTAGAAADVKLELDALAAARADALDAISMHALIEVMALRSPPESVVHVLSAVSCVFGAPRPSLAAARKVMRPPAAAHTAVILRRG